MSQRISCPVITRALTRGPRRVKHSLFLPCCVMKKSGAEPRPFFSLSRHRAMKPIFSSARRHGVFGPPVRSPEADRTELLPRRGSQHRARTARRRHPRDKSNRASALLAQQNGRQGETLYTHPRKNRMRMNSSLP